MEIAGFQADMEITLVLASRKRAGDEGTSQGRIGDK